MTDEVRLVPMRIDHRGRLFPEPSSTRTRTAGPYRRSEVIWQEDAITEEEGRAMGGDRSEELGPVDDLARSGFAKLRAAFPEGGAGMSGERECPDAPVCQTCSCAAEDDVCFPAERAALERAERAEAERDALRRAVVALRQANLAGVLRDSDDRNTALCEQRWRELVAALTDTSEEQA